MRRSARSRATTRPPLVNQARTNSESPPQVGGRHRSPQCRNRIADRVSDLRRVRGRHRDQRLQPESRRPRETVGHRAELTCRDADRSESVLPLRRRRRSKRRLQDTDHSGSMRDPRGIRGERRIPCDLRHAQDSGEPGELAVVATGNRQQVTVTATQQLVRGDRRVPVSHPMRCSSGGEESAGLVGHGPQQAGEQVDLDMLTASVEVTGTERGQDADGGILRRQDIDQRDADLGRLPVRGGR
jgi:hypothetical protein